MVKTDKYVQFEAGKLTYRVVPVTEEIIRIIVSGKEIKIFEKERRNTTVVYGDRKQGKIVWRKFCDRFQIFFDRKVKRD